LMNQNTVKNEHYYYTKAIKLFDNNGSFEDCVELLGKAIEANPEMIEAYIKRAYIYIWFLAEQQKALYDCDTALKLDNNCIEALCYRADIYIYHLHKYNEAINDCAQAIKLNENYIEAYSRRVDAYLELKEYKNAIYDFSKIIELAPSNNYDIIDLLEIHEQRAWCYIQLEFYDKALEDYATMIRMDDSYVRAFIFRGLLYEKLNKADLAKKDFEELRLKSDYDIEKIHNLFII
ncbi:hypothetical protein LJC00_04310, partial [Dysgonomonas sp. OttesenSCG-928-M03]|nr:hypothetical protein [Dysgonomonas sp. OttesenSCG-928-M03]